MPVSLERCRSVRRSSKWRCTWAAWQRRLCWLGSWAGPRRGACERYRRISADLRNRTFAHLQRLSLEYFGGKRTGDLIARIAPTPITWLVPFGHVDRLHHDVLMIVGDFGGPVRARPVRPRPRWSRFRDAWLIVRIRGRLVTGSCAAAAFGRR